MIAITPLYAAILTVPFLVLFMRIVHMRWTLRVGIGDGGEKGLARAIRAHGNFIETVPWAMFLMLLMELTGTASVTMLHMYGGTLVVARCLHAFGLSRHSGASFGRMAGIVLTLLVIMTGAMICARRYFI